MTRQVPRALALVAFFVALFVALFVCFFLPNPSQAQAVYGSIFGTVTDNSGAVVPMQP